MTPMSRSNRFRHPAIDDRPIATINTTPLIDMMLVLLIMFIVAIPVGTHEVPLDLPSGPPRPDQRPVHRLDVDSAGRTIWNGQPVDSIALRRNLLAMARDPARPDLHLNAHGDARYERVDQVLADIRRAGVTRLGLFNPPAFAASIAR
jgi:biopolymer transport protein ExbD